MCYTLARALARRIMQMSRIADLWTWRLCITTITITIIIITITIIIIIIIILMTSSITIKQKITSINEEGYFWSADKFRKLSSRSSVPRSMNTNKLIGIIVKIASNLQCESDISAQISWHVFAFFGGINIAFANILWDRDRDRAEAERSAFFLICRFRSKSHLGSLSRHQEY